MKGKKISQRLFTLGSRGIAHYLAPLIIVVLVGIVGTYLVVASHADATTSSNGGVTANTTTTGNANTGYMVIYTNAGQYNAVKVSLHGGPAGTYHCGANLTSKNNYTYVRLFSNNASRGKFACTPISGQQSYDFVYDSAGRNSKFTNDYISVDIDKGYCTLVHPDPSKIRKVAAGANGHCESDADTPVQQATESRNVMGLSKDKKSLTGYIEVYRPGSPHQSVTKKECTGEVKLKIVKKLKNSSPSYWFANPLKYVGATKTNPSYCVAVGPQSNAIHAGFMQSGDTFTVQSSFPGNAYLAPTAAADVTVKIP